MLCHVVSLDSGLVCVQTPLYLVVETSGSNTEHDYAKLEAFLEEAYNDEIVVDGIIAQDSAQQAAVWNLRESISEGLRHAGPPLYTNSLCHKCHPATCDVP